MEINLGDEQIIELQPAFTAEQIHDKALAKRLDAFGQMAKLIQRPKLEDIVITTTQKRLEPFWFGAATARYVYDRRQTYHVEVAPEVQSINLYGNDLAATQRNVTLDAIAHCIEESRQEMILDAQKGNAANFEKHLTALKNPVTEIAALNADGTLVIAPEVRGSFVVRKLVTALMKTFQADKIHEERIDVEHLILYYHPVFAIEYHWPAKDKKQVLDFDGLTGEFKAESGELKKKVVSVLENDALFDIGADAIGTVLPGVNVAVKLGRLAARKVIK